MLIGLLARYDQHMKVMVYSYGSCHVLIIAELALSNSYWMDRLVWSTIVISNFSLNRLGWGRGFYLNPL